MGKGSKASAKASQKAKRFAGNLKTAKPTPEGYASIDSFWESYQQAFVETSKGKMEIQSLDPGEFLLFNDTPFVAMLAAKGAKEGESTLDYFNAFSDAEKEELGTFNVKKCVCRGVIRPHFVNKRPYECNRDMEISVDLLSQEDLITLYNAIKQISVPEELAEKANEFRKESGNGEGGTVEDSPDSEDVSQITKPNIIPENN